MVCSTELTNAFKQFGCFRHTRLRHKAEARIPLQRPATPVSRKGSELLARIPQRHIRVSNAGLLARKNVKLDQSGGLLGL
jgi:hypothetical protein